MHSFQIEMEKQFLHGNAYKPPQWYVDTMTAMDNNPTPMLDLLSKNIGAPLNYPKTSYGRLVRIPIANPREGSYVYEDVTVKTAKKRAKAARKLARQIDKACR